MTTKKKRKLIQYELPLLPNVRLKGLEPPRLTTLDPKSSAATNYATAAWYTFASQTLYFLMRVQIYSIYLDQPNYLILFFKKSAHFFI